MAFEKCFNSLLEIAGQRFVILFCSGFIPQDQLLSGACEISGDRSEKMVMLFLQKEELFLNVSFLRLFQFGFLGFCLQHVVTFPVELEMLLKMLETFCDGSGDDILPVFEIRNGRGFTGRMRILARNRESVVMQNDFIGEIDWNSLEFILRRRIGNDRVRFLFLGQKKSPESNDNRGVD